MSQIIQFIQAVFSLLPFNTFDYIFMILFTIYVWEDIQLGIFSTFTRFCITIVSFFTSIGLYSLLSNLINANFPLTKGLSDAFAFLFIGFILYTVLSITSKRLIRHYHNSSYSKRVPGILDNIGGLFFGSATFLLIASFVIALILSFPTSGFVKNQIRNSVTGKFLSLRSHVLDTQVKKVFGGAIEDTLNFMTVKPNSDAFVTLHFKAKKYEIDYTSEQEMLILVNRERAKAGKKPVFFDENLAEVARNHSIDMLTRGYFSHYTPEDKSPFDRLEENGIVYKSAGENLAFAPDVDIAMDGLMKSPGHRENILSADFNKIGIGAVDAGIFGKMFVQEFTN